MTSLEIPSDEPTPAEAPGQGSEYVADTDEQPFGEFDMGEAANIARRLSELEQENRSKAEEIEELKAEIARRDEAIEAHEFSKAVAEKELESTHEKRRAAEVLDSLTGLLNVKGIKERAQSILDEGREFGVLYIDLANFKAINDKLGHDVGDEVLKKIARIIAKDIRGEDENAERSSDAVARVKEDLVPDPKHPARLHGDEFLIVVGDDGDHSLEDTLTIVRDRILSDIGDLSAADAHLEGIKFGADLGMAVYDEVADESVEDTIKRADTNMRFMKRRRQSREGSYR